MKIAPWFWPTLFLATALTGFVYATVQQVYRQSANDPQVQLAQDAAQTLSQGVDPVTVVRSATVELSHSAAPFLMVLGEDHKLLASSARLDGNMIQPPDGVLDAAKKAEHRVTWQPRSDIREALVIEHIKSDAGGFVVVGRSLLETESRVDQLGRMILLAWGVMVLGLFALALIPSLRKS